MRRTAYSPFLVPVLAVLWLLSGCSFGRHQPPTRLYTLTALPYTDSVRPVAATQGLAIGVGPVELPQYVNRPQVVTGNTHAELQSEAFSQWAEPLETNFARVLAENLAVLLTTERVAVYPWKGPVPIDYQVVVEVIQFLGEPGGQVSLAALWRIVGANGRDVLISRATRYSEPVGGREYDALAAAMSRTVAALSQDIAAAITTLRQTAAR
jgi:uncharacterized protein